MNALLTLALAYAGFTAVCLAMDRHHRQIFRHPPARRAATMLRCAGFALLALAAVPVVIDLPGSVGIIAWLGLLTAAALPLIFLLPYAPRVAAKTAVIAPVVAVVATLAGV